MNRFGLAVREHYQSGLLRKGKSQVVKTTLHAGNEYYFVAGGCEDAYDVDIAIYDENWNLIERDNDNQAVAAVKVKPRWTGKFYVKITMYNSTSDGAHWVLQTAFKNLVD